MGDKAKGLYNKFRIERTDGSSAEGGKHFNCGYFVLDIDHDQHAIPALLAYAKSCGKDGYRELAKDILTLIPKTGAETLRIEAIIEELGLTGWANASDR